MKALHTTRRRGATLMEVLAAMFIMSVGMLSLLSLFPLGATRMADAVSAERTAQAAAQARMVSSLLNVRFDARATPYFANPDPSGVYQNAQPSGASYPVYMDPWGAASGTFQWVGGGLGPTPRTIRRCDSGAAPFGASRTGRLSWFTLLDDIVYDVNGTPQMTGGVFRRNIRYTWAFMLQQPRSSDPSTVTCSAVIYDGRPLTANLPEDPYPANFDATRNIVTLSFGAASVQPSIRSGDWILDSSAVSSSGNVVGAHGYFYRVVGINEVPGSNLELEVQSPLRGFSGATNSGNVIVMQNVVDVFDLGVGRRP